MASQKKRRRPALGYLIPAVVLLGVLVYSLLNAFVIFNSQSREQDAYEELGRIAHDETPPAKDSGTSAGNAAKKAADGSNHNADANGNNRNANAGDNGQNPDSSDNGQGADADDQETGEGLAELHERNADMVGWLSIDDSVIDYPVMQPPPQTTPISTSITTSKRRRPARAVSSSARAARRIRTHS